MSRSYKKVGAYAWAGGSDKWNRSRYHRDERRKVKRLLKEQERYGTETWKPVTETCGFDGDICYVDDWWYCNPEEYIINYDESSLPNTYSVHPDCLVCGWAYEYHGKELVGPEEEPWEKIVMNAIDYSLHSADKYSWASDGGAYWRDDKSSIRTVFDRDIFGAPQHSWRWAYKESTVWERYVAERNARHNKKHPQLSVHIEYRKERLINSGWSFDCGDHDSDIWFTHYDKFRRVVVVPYNREHKYPKTVFDGIDGEVTRVSVYKRRGPKQLQNPKWDVIDYAISIAPTTFHGPKDLIEWLRAHQEDIIDGMFKRRFGK